MYFERTRDIMDSKSRTYTTQRPAYNICRKNVQILPNGFLCCVAYYAVYSSDGFPEPTTLNRFWTLLLRLPFRLYQTNYSGNIKLFRPEQFGSASRQLEPSESIPELFRNSRRNHRSYPEPYFGGVIWNNPDFCWVYSSLVWSRP